MAWRRQPSVEALSNCNAIGRVLNRMTFYAIIRLRDNEDIFLTPAAYLS